MRNYLYLAAFTAIGLTMTAPAFADDIRSNLDGQTSFKMAQATSTNASGGVLVDSGTAATVGTSVNGSATNDDTIDSSEPAAAASGRTSSRDSLGLSAGVAGVNANVGAGANVDTNSTLGAQTGGAPSSSTTGGSLSSQTGGSVSGSAGN